VGPSATVAVGNGVAVGDGGAVCVGAEVVGAIEPPVDVAVGAGAEDGGAHATSNAATRMPVINLETERAALSMSSSSEVQSKHRMAGT